MNPHRTPFALQTFQRLLGVILLLALLAGQGQMALAQEPGGSPAYLDPALLSSASGTLEVIVTASSSAKAARAVRNLGGTVGSDLWLIDAVAARIPASQVYNLASITGVRSVVANQGVRSASWDGYASDLRVLSGEYQMDGQPANPALYLPDGDFVSVSANGAVLFVNGDGTERARIFLPEGAPFTAAPRLGDGDTLFVSGENLRLYALAPDGEMRWTYAAQGTERFIGSAAPGLEGSVYQADSRGVVYALEATSGLERWRFSVPEQAGRLVTGPAVAPDGSLYLITDRGFVYAINPDGSMRWAAGLGKPLGFHPLFGPGNLLYLASPESGELIGLEAVSGMQLFSFSAGARLSALPVIGPEGSLYLPAGCG